MEDKDKTIVLFDSHCVLCNSSVKFLLKHNTSQSLFFSTLQSDVANEILLHHKTKKVKKDSVLFFDGGELYEKSTATLKIVNHLSPFWHFLKIFWIIPKPIRDFLYDVIAKNRYKWFGQTETCYVLTESNKNRFI